MSCITTCNTSCQSQHSRMRCSQRAGTYRSRGTFVVPSASSTGSRRRIWSGILEKFSFMAFLSGTKLMRSGASAPRRPDRGLSTPAAGRRCTGNNVCMLNAIDPSAKTSSASMVRLDGSPCIAGGRELRRNPFLSSDFYFWREPTSHGVPCERNPSLRGTHGVVDLVIHGVVDLVSAHEQCCYISLHQMHH